MFLVRDGRLIVLSEERSKQPRAGDRVVLLARRTQVQQTDDAAVLSEADLASAAETG
jgi:hypothetical protein